jgi:hypothetical protein
VGRQRTVKHPERVPPTANGNATPIAVITGDATNLDTPDGITQDPAGRLLVADAAGPSIDTFATPVTTSGPAPVATLTGPLTQLAYPIGVDVDAAGRKYVGNQFGALTVYAAGAQGGATPLATIAGPATGLSAPGAVAVLPPLHIATHLLRRARVGRRYHLQLRALLGRSPLRWRIARGRLPPGLRLTRAGAISWPAPSRRPGAHHGHGRRLHAPRHARPADSPFDRHSRGCCRPTPVAGNVACLSPGPPIPQQGSALSR